MNAILVTVDAGYARILRLFLKCLDLRYPHHPRVIVCASGWCNDLRATFDREFRYIDWLDASSLTYPVGPAMGHNPAFDRPIMYARLAAFSSVFDAYDTILYLDVDILVLAPLDELFAMTELVAFRESYGHRAALIFRNTDDPALLERLREDGINETTWPAVNAGVLVLPRSCRTATHLAEMHRLVARYAKWFRWGDQSLLNVWLARNGIRPVWDYRFNFQIRQFNDEEAKRSFRAARILHFNGAHDDTAFLMALSYCLLNFTPGGKTLIPLAVRLGSSQAVNRLPGFRLRQWMRRRLLDRLDLLAPPSGSVQARTRQQPSPTNRLVARALLGKRPE